MWPVISKKLDYDPTEPLRVAVLPVRHLDESGMQISTHRIFFIDNLPTFSDPRGKSGAEVVKSYLYDELNKTHFDVVREGVLRAELVHRGLIKEENFDLQKIYQADTKTLASWYGADAVLYTDITEWDRTYYGVETVIDVGLDLKLVRASDGKELYKVNISDSSSSGISKGPTGYTSVVIEPIKAFDLERLNELAQEVVEEAFEPLVGVVEEER